MIEKFKESLSTYSSLISELRKNEQKLDDILMYTDFIDNRFDLPIILLKDCSVMLMFEISGVDYEQLSADDRASLSESVKLSFLQLDRGFTLSNYLDRDVNKLFSLEKGR